MVTQRKVGSNKLKKLKEKCMLAAKIQKERSDANDSKILMEWAATMYEECSLAVNN